MLVTQEIYGACIERIQEHSIFALDTETNGLHPHSGDRLFSIAIATTTGSYYFDFQKKIGRAHV